MTDVGVSTSFRLLSTGPVSGLLALLIFVAAAAFVLWQLRLEFPGTRRAKLERFVLPAIRVAIVGLLAWLLAQPVLLIVSRSLARPQTLVITGGGKSMSVVEDFASPAAKLDALQAIGGDVPKGRVNDGSTIAIAADGVRELIDANLPPLKSAASDLSAGLPPSRDATRALDAIVKSLREKTDAFAVSPSRRTRSDDKTRAAIVASVQTLRARCEALGADAAMVTREASRQPALLDDFITRASAVREDCAELMASANKWQAELDRSKLGDAAIRTIATQQTKRSDFAAKASQQASSRLERDATVTHQSPPTLDDALSAIFQRRLSDPVTRAIVLADGATALSDRGAEKLAAIVRMKIPVDTVLVGADGVEPRDAGLIAVDAPSLAVLNQAITARSLVKNRLAASARPKLVVRDANATLATVDVPASTDSSVVALSFTPMHAGATQLSFEIDTGSPDAYAGNERITQTIDVLPARARVIVLADALANNYAAIMRVLSEMPAVDATGIIAAPEITKLKTGSKSGEFPAKLDDWKSVRLVVLLGNVPKDLPKESLDAMKQAIEAGTLHAFVQGAGWCDALGIATTVSSANVALSPDPQHWLPLYQLAPTRSESLRRFSAIPPIAGARTTSAADGISIFGSIVRVIPRGKGAILFCGIPNFSAMRNDDVSPSRIVAGLMSLAISGSVADAPPPADESDFALAAHAAPLKQIASATGGQFVTIDRLPKLWESKRSASTAREELRRVSVSRNKLWSGPWSLVALLGLASAEYLLRRRAGRVM